MFSPGPVRWGCESHQGQEEETGDSGEEWRQTGVFPMLAEAQPPEAALKGESSETLGSLSWGFEVWTPLQVPQLLSPSDSSFGKAAANPRALPCTHPLHVIHFSKCSLSSLPSHLTLLAAPPGEQHQGFYPHLTASAGQPRVGSDLLKATQLTSNNWPSGGLALRVMPILHSTQS